MVQKGRRARARAGRHRSLGGEHDTKHERRRRPLTVHQQPTIEVNDAGQGREAVDQGSVEGPPRSSELPCSFIIGCRK